MLNQLSQEWWRCNAPSSENWRTRMFPWNKPAACSTRRRCLLNSEHAQCLRLFSKIETNSQRTQQRFAGTCHIRELSLVGTAREHFTARVLQFLSQLLASLPDFSLRSLYLDNPPPPPILDTPIVWYIITYIVVFRIGGGVGYY